MSRDPIEEAGGLNLYGFIDNDPQNQWDRLGLWIETAWDAANVAADIVSLGDNLGNGNRGDAGVDAGGLILDGLSTAIPAVPAIADPMIKAKRAPQKVVKEAAEKQVKQRRKPQELVLHVLQIRPKHTKLIPKQIQRELLTLVESVGPVHRIKTLKQEIKIII